MMAETVHDFPLFGGESGYQIKVLERGVFHVDEVVGDTGDGEH